MDVLIKRITIFLVLVVASLIISWYFFLLFALIYIYFVKNPIELILAGVIVDKLVFLQSGEFWYDNRLAVFSLVCVVVAEVLSKRMDWQKLV